MTSDQLKLRVRTITLAVTALFLAIILGAGIRVETAVATSGAPRDAETGSTYLAPHPTQFPSPPNHPRAPSTSFPIALHPHLTALSAHVPSPLDSHLTALSAHVPSPLDSHPIALSAPVPGPPHLHRTALSSPVMNQLHPHPSAIPAPVPNSRDTLLARSPAHLVPTSGSHSNSSSRPRSVRDGPGRFRWPLEPAPAVVRPFNPPPTPYAAGHRGVDLAAVPGAPVLAAADGVVVFAGRVVDREVVAITHDGGLRTTYEPVVPSVSPGQRVRAGDRIGVVVAGHRGCPAAACLHWGLRREGVYLDPLLALVELRVRLLPH